MKKRVREVGIMAGVVVSSVALAMTAGLLSAIFAYSTISIAEAMSNPRQHALLGATGEGHAPGVTGHTAEVLAWAAGVLLVAFVWVVFVRLGLKNAATESEVGLSSAVVLAPTGTSQRTISYPGKERVHDMRMWLTGREEYYMTGEPGEVPFTHITILKAGVQVGDWLVIGQRLHQQDMPYYYQVSTLVHVPRPAHMRASTVYCAARIELVPEEYVLRQL